MWSPWRWFQAWRERRWAYQQAQQTRLDALRLLLAAPQIGCFRCGGPAAPTDVFCEQCQHAIRGGR
jgi:hypothetical protein